MALAVFPLVLGRLAETMPKRPLIVTGSLLFSALIVVLLAAPLYRLLIAGAALAGLGSAFVEPAMGSIYLGATTDENRGQVMGMRGWLLDYATDHFRYRCGSVREHGAGRLSPLEES
jgi:MFS family permease